MEFAEWKDENCYVDECFYEGHRKPEGKVGDIEDRGGAAWEEIIDGMARVAYFNNEGYREIGRTNGDKDKTCVAQVRWVK